MDKYRYRVVPGNSPGKWLPQWRHWWWPFWSNYQSSDYVSNLMDLPRRYDNMEDAVEFLKADREKDRKKQNWKSTAKGVELKDE